LELGGRDRLAQRGHAQHPPAGRDHLGIGERRPGVKHLDIGQLCRVFQTSNRLAFRVTARIALAGHHDAHGRARIPLQSADPVQAVLGSRLQDVGQIRLQPHQQRLALRVAEAHVVLEHLRALARDHQPGVQHPQKRHAFAFHGVYGRHQDVRFDPPQHLVAHHRRWAVGPHAARVRSAVAVIGRFVVLSRRQRQDGATVGDRQHAGFLAVQAFLDDQLPARVAKDTLPGDLVDGRQDFRPLRTDDHSLARRQAIGFHDQGDFLVLVGVAVQHVLCRLASVGEHAIVGRRHIGVAEQLFAEYFAAFQLGRRLGGAEDPQLGGLEGVHDAVRQRGFWADHGQIDVLGAGELDQPLRITDRDIHILGIRRRSGVAGRDEDPLHTRTLRQLPSQSVFPTAVADHQYVHPRAPLQRVSPRQPVHDEPGF